MVATFSTENNVWYSKEKHLTGSPCCPVYRVEKIKINRFVLFKSDFFYFFLFFLNLIYMYTMS